MEDIEAAERPIRATSKIVTLDQTGPPSLWDANDVLLNDFTELIARCLNEIKHATSQSQDTASKAYAKKTKELREVFNLWRDSRENIDQQVAQNQPMRREILLDLAFLATDLRQGKEDLQPLLTVLTCLKG